MKFYLTVLLLGFLVACSDDHPKEPVAADPAFADIDPDQKALPKESAASGEAVPAETAVVDASKQAPTPPAVPTPAEEVPAASPAPTPTVEELTSSDAGQKVEQQSAAAPAVQPEGVPGTPTGSGPKTRYVKAFEMNIRSKPNRHSQIVGHLRGGDEVHVSIHGGWSKLDDGRWIRTRWLVKNPPDKLTSTPPDEEGRSHRNKKVRHIRRSKRSTRGSKS